MSLREMRARRAELLHDADALTKLEQRTAVQDNRIDECLHEVDDLKRQIQSAEVSARWQDAAGDVRQVEQGNFR